MNNKHDSPFRSALRKVHNRLFALLAFAGLAFGLYQLHFNPETPLPPAWNASRSLLVSDPISPLTFWKLDRALASPTACLEALSGSAAFSVLEPLIESDECHIRNRVALRRLADVSLSSVETSCAIALRAAMWERHDLRPAAARLFNSEIERIIHVGSYNCRPIRTGAQGETRWSTHATAEALDISGFQLTGGLHISLLEDWGTNGPKASFLMVARDTACDWFPTALGPDFNTLHADHFHLQSRGWGTCR